MVNVYLYGNLRRLAPDRRAGGDSLVKFDAQPGDTVATVLDYLDLAPEEISTIFYNSSLLVTRNSMAAWLGYIRVRADPHVWDLDFPLQDGDRLGIFGMDMPALVV